MVYKSYIYVTYFYSDLEKKTRKMISWNKKHSSFGVKEKHSGRKNSNEFKKNICFKNTFWNNRLNVSWITYASRDEDLFLNSKQKMRLKTQFVKKKLINGYSKIHEVKLVTIGIASPQKIQSWAEKELPNGKIFGEVTNANTFHYRTFKASKGGLFCERIFGPIKDFECACGKRQKPSALESKKILEHVQTNRSFCPNCDVEYTWSIIRRYQLGYIKLNAPVAHLWYFRANPSYLSILFDMKRKNLESIIYCNETITIENMWKYAEQHSNLTNSPTELYAAWQKFFHMEETLKKYQVFFEKKEALMKEKKQLFRETIMQKPNFQTQINWKTIALDTSLKKLDMFEKSDFMKNEQHVLKTKTDLFFQILKNKQKTQIFLVFEEQWKHFLKTTFSKTLVLLASEHTLFTRFFKNDEQLHHLFLLYSKKKYRLLDQTRRFSFFTFSEKSSISSVQQKKTYYKLLFFLFEFLNFILCEQKKQFHRSQALEKKDVLFLLNVIPFLKKLYTFRTGKFQKKKSKTLHSFFGRMLRHSPQKKQTIHKFFSGVDDSFFHKATLAEYNKKQNRFSLIFNGFEQTSKLSSIHYVSSINQLMFQPQKSDIKKMVETDSILLEHFQKMFAALKMYYAITFCSIFQNNQLAFQEGFISASYESKKQHEHHALEYIRRFFDVSKNFKLLETEGFSNFVILFTLFQSNQFSHLSLLNHTFFNKKSMNDLDISIFQSEKAFVLYRANDVFFFRNSFFEEEKKVLNNQTASNQLLGEKYKPIIEIFNKPMSFRKNLLFQKKQKLVEQLNKFYVVDKFSNEFEGILASKKVGSGTGFKLSKIVKEIHAQKNPMCKRQFLVEENDYSNQTRRFLKNRVSTIAFHYPWTNDIEWKYFVYYQSFFFQEVEDIPIFRYASLAYGKTGLQTKNFLFSESLLTGSKDFASSPFLTASGSRNQFSVGAGILEKLLIEYTSVELRKMTKQHQILLPKINQTLRFLKQNVTTKKDSLKIQKYFQKREAILRRLKLLRKFSQRNSNPMFMILRNLPVLPPDLRPILKLQNQIAASDLNRFYQRIIYRNDRLKKFGKDSVTNQSFEMKYAQRLLQEAVDNLIQNGKGSGKAETNSRGQPLKSLSEILKGKQGRFRQYLLGKRVDYSGRSVIVVGPKLKLYECGLPKEMALELFLPFLIQYILQTKLAQTVIGAKQLLKSNETFTMHVLHKVMKNSPILLNRAPTLHRLGFQAFIPKLIEGRAILLHPMVCPAFNADFDGDQMAVHIPLTVEARTEAWKLMLSINNLINSATGEAIVLPSQDMVLGCYYLTLDFRSKFFGVQMANALKDSLKTDSKFPMTNFKKFLQQNKSFLLFQNFFYVLNAYQRQEISLHTPVWIQWNAPVNFANDFSKPIEIRLRTNGSWQRIQPKYTVYYTAENNLRLKYIRTTVGRILINFMIQECRK